MYRDRGYSLASVEAKGSRSAKVEESKETTKKRLDDTCKQSRASPSITTTSTKISNGGSSKDNRSSDRMMSAPSTSTAVAAAAAAAAATSVAGNGRRRGSYDSVTEDEDSDTDSADELSGSEGDDTSWIQWFCALKGNEFFCEIDEEYIQDDFNLSGLSSQVPYYEYALDLLLDAESPTDDLLTDEQHEMVESAAEMLYGLIHVRYILTTKGLNAMREKQGNVDFGRCPRVHCCGQSCLPVGQSDVPRQCTVKIFCPKCEDIYYPRTKYQGNVDGAYFGTTFPHLFYMTYPYLRPVKPVLKYVPKIYGFKIHKDAK